jgi:hypothetical protein
VNTGKTLFAQLMDFLPWSTFIRIVARYDGDVRIPTIETSHSDASRPPIPIDCDRLGAGAEGAIGCSLRSVSRGLGGWVKHGETARVAAGNGAERGRPDSQGEGPARAAACPDC